MRMAVNELGFGVTTPGKPYEGMTVGSYYVYKAFEKGRSMTKTCRFKTSGAPDPNVTNYYGYAEVAEPFEKNDGVTNLVLIKRNRMAVAIPALMVHQKKKIRSL